MKFGQFLRRKDREKEKNDQYMDQPLAEQFGGFDDEQGWRPEQGWSGGAKKKPSGKESKQEKEIPQKEFFPGDILKLVDDKQSRKVPQDAWDFLMTYKEYKVRKVNDKGKIDLGCRISKNTPEGGVEKIYMFSPNRFELKDARPEGWVKPEPTVATAIGGEQPGVKPLKRDEDGNLDDGDDGILDANDDDQV